MAPATARRGGGQRRRQRDESPFSLAWRTLSADGHPNLWSPTSSWRKFLVATCETRSAASPRPKCATPLSCVPVTLNSINYNPEAGPTKRHGFWWRAGEREVAEEPHDAARRLMVIATRRHDRPGRARADRQADTRFSGYGMGY